MTRGAGDLDQAPASFDGVTVAPIEGDALQAALPALARLRIAVFRAYPYLYDGDLAYEARYVEKFAAAPGAVIIGAVDQGEIVGAATGAPMLGQMDAWADPFREKGYDISTLFYCGESVLLPGYRGRGIGHAFFDQREAQARRLGLTHSCFCGVVRPEDHPARPANHQPLDGFWLKRGYAPLDGVTAAFEWKEVGETAESLHQLQFWLKTL